MNTKSIVSNSFLKVSLIMAKSEENPPAAYDDPTKVIAAYRKKNGAKGSKKRVIRMSGQAGPNTNAVRNVNRRRAWSGSKLITYYSISNISY